MILLYLLFQSNIQVFIFNFLLPINCQSAISSQITEQSWNGRVWASSSIFSILTAILRYTLHLVRSAGYLRFRKMKFGMVLVDLTIYIALIERHRTIRTMHRVTTAKQRFRN